jgi:type II secretory pathway component GspD/PulD (secretin)
MRSRYLLVLAFLAIGIGAGLLRAFAGPVAQSKPRLEKKEQERGEPNFEVIRLRNAKALPVGRILEALFNGPKPSGLKGSGLVRIRVVPDPRTNSLLVMASSTDLATLRKLVDQSLDRPEDDAGALNRPGIIGPPKFAEAADVASVIREVYRHSRPSFSVAVDRRTNSLVLACPAQLHQEIRQLVEQLDAAAKDAQPRRVWVIGLKNAVAADLAKVLRTAYGDSEKSVGFTADMRTNSLVVRCPAAREAEISGLVRELDSKRTPK